MTQPHLTYEELCKCSNRELDRLLEQGLTPDMDLLHGWEGRGYNVNPGSEILRIRKFKKGFYRTAGSSAFQGYNVKVEQNGLLNPWIPKLRHGEPIKHALYKIYRVRKNSKDSLYPAAMMLDYGAGDNPLLDPSRILRDYMVQVYADNPDLYLGKAYAALGPARVFGGFFVLERYNKVL